jgi:hypothetical protein
MFVNKIPFLVTISRYLKFGTVEALKERTATQIMRCIKTVRGVYNKRGFRIRTILANGEFEALRGSLLEDEHGRIQLDTKDLEGDGADINVAGNDEHVPEVERYIRTVKDRTRSTRSTLPFQKIPAVMIIEMVYAAVFWLNTFPPNDGVSDMSPRELITGNKLDYNKHCKLELGAYVQTHETHNNTMTDRTTGAISLRPTGNQQGGYYFMSLASGRRLNRKPKDWTELPMPQEVLDRVHTLARRSQGALTFAWRDGSPILNDEEDDDVDDEDFVPEDDESDDEHDYDEPDDHPGDDGEAPGGANVEYANVDATTGPGQEDAAPTTGDDPTPALEIGGNTGTTNDADVETQENAGAEVGVAVKEEGDPTEVITEEVTEVITVEEEGDDDDDVTSVAEESDDDNVGAAMDEKYGPRGRDGLRARRERGYGHLNQSAQGPHEQGQIHAQLESTAFTQYSVKKGLKVFGQAGVDAVVSEMRQLDERKVIEPKNAALLTRSEKRDALQYLMFLKQKRCGRIKGRGCADGRKQRAWKTKEESSAPTVAIESLFLSATMDAHERRDVATADIPGAFMQANIDELVHVRLEGPLARLLVKVNEDLYSKYIVMERGKPVIYVKLLKALYGTLQAALLFWTDLSEFLVEKGYTLNPYDSCVANKTINGKQCTILWHVDDLKISHIDSLVVDGILSELNTKYGKEAPLTVTRGKIHDYLGLTLDFSDDGKVKVRMEDYVESILEDAPANMDGEAPTPAAQHLFTVNDDGEKLGQEDADLFHQMTAKLLFLGKRARPDIQAAVAFLTTRVQEPDTDDYKKLARTIKYLRATPKLVLTLEAEGMAVTKWWVDAAFAVHRDMKSHTGGTMSMGKGSIYSTSIRQKLNTTSSTEAELVGVADVMPMMLWTRYFLQAQGYDVGKTKLYQDNMSSMLLEKNGRASSGKRTRHINIRYFFVADRVKAQELEIEYCPTDDMTGDFFTKPLQGSKFLRFRNAVMNIKP